MGSIPVGNMIESREAALFFCAFPRASPNQNKCGEIRVFIEVAVGFLTESRTMKVLLLLSKVYYDYESELYPAYYHEPQDFDWGKACLLSMPTDILLKSIKSTSRCLKKCVTKSLQRNAGKGTNIECGFKRRMIYAIF